MFRRTGFIIVNDESDLIARGVPNDIAVRDKGSPILIVIASVDVQENCLFVDVKGYSYGGVTWTLEFVQIKGNTAEFNGVWDRLAAMLGNKQYIGTDNKVYKIEAAMIDTGYNATYVYTFLENHPDGVFGCKGKNYLTHGETYQWFSPSARKRIGEFRAYP